MGRIPLSQFIQSFSISPTNLGYKYNSRILRMIISHKRRWFIYRKAILNNFVRCLLTELWTKLASSKLQFQMEHLKMHFDECISRSFRLFEFKHLRSFLCDSHLQWRSIEIVRTIRVCLSFSNWTINGTKDGCGKYITKNLGIMEQVYFYTKLHVYRRVCVCV